MKYSNKDVTGVFLAAPSHYIGIIKQKDVREQWYNEWGCVHYEILKLAGLLEKGNPKVLSLLWLEPHHVIHTSAAWAELLAIREAFYSKQVYHSFVGYANSQLYRMTHLVRLLRMGIEFLTEGILHVERKNDAAQLLEIKRGQGSFEASPWTVLQ